MAFHRLALSRRCFSFGMGPRACRRLLKGMAKVSRGCAEFLSPTERLQPKVMPGWGQGDAGATTVSDTVSSPRPS